MVKFYLKIENNILIKNLLYAITAIVLSVNLLIRIFPRFFIHVPTWQNTAIKVTPTVIYNYCDAYLLVLFIILIFFYLGVDFKNSMEQISLAIGGSKTNKFMLRKLISILILYLFLYVISFINVYILYIQLLPSNATLIPLKEIIFYSLTTNVFIISLSLFILFISRDISISTVIITAYYLIEESLWRCKVTEKKGILGHIYYYYDYSNGELLKVKIFYILLSVVLLFITYKLAERKI